MKYNPPIYGSHSHSAVHFLATEPYWVGILYKQAEWDAKGFFIFFILSFWMRLQATRQFKHSTAKEQMIFYYRCREKVIKSQLRESPPWQLCIQSKRRFGAPKVDRRDGDLFHYRMLIHFVAMFPLCSRRSRVAHFEAKRSIRMFWILLWCEIDTTAW